MKLQLSAIILTLLVCFITIKSARSAKILSLAFMSGKSHMIVYTPLLEELAKRGHDVTVVSPFPPKSVKNIRGIVTIDTNTLDLPNIFEMKEKKETLNPFVMFDFFDTLCRKTYDLQEVKNLMSEKFDLIIFETLFNDCALGLVNHFNTTLVQMSLVSAPPIFSWVTGAPAPPSFVPHFFLSYTDKMNYFERMINFAVIVGMHVIQEFYFKPKMEVIYREKLGNPNIPGVNDILANTSLILSNGHFSTSPPKPFFPDIVEVGGMACRPAQKLPKDLEEFVTSSGKDGFIYFSMGSVIKTETMPEKYRKILLNVFSKLKQKIIWKWEGEMNDLPGNVKLGKWLPQQDILGHSNIRMFITHGGYGGTTEAVFHGVPLLGMPMFGDQLLNMQKAELSGFALTLQFDELSEEKLLAAISRILNEPSFTDKVRSLSKIFRDQPEKPLDRAVYWTEYVIRHKGAVHMRSAARDLNFIQYHSLDVMASYAAIIFAVLYSVFAFFRYIFRKLWGSSSTSSNKLNRRKKTD